MSASTVSYTGSLADDSSVALVPLTVAANSTVTFQTFSYAGGVNGAGTSIPSGGFDPLIDLFNGSGTLIAENDDGNASVPADPQTAERFDVYLQTTLGAGTYTLALAQFDNFAVGPILSSGFNEDSPTFTAAFGCSNGAFCDLTAANRTANWALDITATPVSSATPEPSATALLGLGLSAFVLVQTCKAVGRRQWSQAK